MICSESSRDYFNKFLQRILKGILCASTGDIVSLNNFLRSSLRNAYYILEI